MSNKSILMIMIVLMALFVVTMPVSAMPVSAKAVGTIVSQGATVFIGEEELNIVNALNSCNVIGWWASGSDSDSSPSRQINVNGREGQMMITQSEFAGYTGNWYCADSSSRGAPVFYVEDPYLDFDIWDPVNQQSVNGKSVVQGSELTFKINTNLAQINNGKRNTSGNITSPSTTTTIEIERAAAKPHINGTTDTWTDLAVITDGGTIISTTNVITPVGVDQELYNHTAYGAGSTPMTITTSDTTLPSGNYTITLYYAEAYLNPISAGDRTFNVTINGSVKETAFDVYAAAGSTKNKAVSKTYSITKSSVGPITIVLTPVNEDPMISGVLITRTDIIPSVTTNEILPLNPATDGFINIKVKDENGATYTYLYNSAGVTVPLTSQFVNAQPYYWDGGNVIGRKWFTGSKVGGHYDYPQGVYSVYVESDLNKMKDNYRSGGADYTGKTVSAVYKVTIAASSVKLAANKQAVVRGNGFTVTLTGQPYTTYYFGLKGTSSIESGSSEIPPIMTMYQEGVSNLTPGQQYHAKVETDGTGIRTVAFTTSNSTKERKYTIRAESLDFKKYDEVVVTVAEGSVTLMAKGNQIYYLGEEIKFSGTNSETNTVYLFITGPNLNSNGARIENPGSSVINGDESTFEMIDVDSDDSFTYDWPTAMVDLDAGTYTVYAISQPHDKGHLSDTAYATTSITIKKPYVSAKIPQNTVAKGDKITIEGIASGQPANVQIWILGKNFVKIATQSVDNDDTYKYEMPEGETTDMASGQYFLIVQHPMQNSQFDIVAESRGDVENAVVRNLQLGDGDGMDIFTLEGGGSLQGSDAAEALVQAINDPNIDDTYTKLNFMLTESIIAIDPIPDKSIGDKFTLVGRTNLAIDDEVMIEIYSSSFGPTVKTKSGEFSGTTATVKVKKGTKDDGFNMFTLDVDASSFKADEYLVLAQGVVQEATGTALFNVKEIVILPPTAVVTAEPALTPIAPITVPPTVPTVMPTTVVPTTTKSPGFGAIYALVGLIGIGFVIVRREE